MLTLIFLAAAVAAFATFFFSSVEQTIIEQTSKYVPELTGQHIRWIGLVIGFFSAWIVFNFYIALILAGVIWYVKEKRNGQLFTR